MKILFLTDNFPPEVNAPAIRTYEHCKEWVQSGHDVTVITCAPNFPKGRVYDGYRNKRVQKSVIDGIKVIRVWTYMAANSGSIKRTLDYISFGVSAFFASLTIKCDLIIATSPQFFTALGGRWSSTFKRVPWYMEVRDLWPESIKAVGAIKNEKILRFLENVEIGLYKHAKGVIVVTDSFKQNLVNRSIDPAKIYVVKNGIDLDEFSNYSAESDLRVKYDIAPNKFVVGYIGTHGLAHKLDFIIEHSNEFDKDVLFVFIGDGAEKQRLQKIYEDGNYPNVLMLPSVPKEQIKNYISMLDVALVNLKKSDTFKSVIPSKIFENAALSKPILLGVEGESKELVEKYNAGIAYEPENAADSINKLTILRKDSKLYAELKEGCKALAMDFDRKMLAHKMLSCIKE